MKKMSAKSTQRCTYCKSRAEWRSNVLASVKYACKDHIEDLRKHQEAAATGRTLRETVHQFLEIDPS